MKYQTLGNWTQKRKQAASSNGRGIERVGAPHEVMMKFHRSDLLDFVIFSLNVLPSNLPERYDSHAHAGPVNPIIQTASQPNRATVKSDTFAYEKSVMAG